MATDPGDLVESGYDTMAPLYLATFGDGIPDDPRVRFVAELADRLSDGARVLELGCGAGVPATALLMTRTSSPSMRPLRSRGCAGSLSCCARTGIGLTT